MMTLLLSVLQTLVDYDTSISLAINGWHTDYWDNFMEFFTGRFLWIPFYLSFAVAIFRNFHWKVCTICLVSAVLLLVINDQLCSSVIRHAVARMRPSNLQNPVSALIYVVDGYRGGRYGFPSAHATNSWGLTFFMIYVFRRRCLTITMMLWALAMCYSRLYMGVHYFGDVLVGMLLGLIDASIVYGVLHHFWPYVLQVFLPRHSASVKMYLPVAVCLLSVLIMLVLAFFIDPSIKL